MKRASLLFAFAAALAAAAPSSAEIVLEGVHWQVGRVERGRVTSWRDARVLSDAPPKLDNRLRARLVLRNNGDKPEETLLIRYSLTARIAPSSGDAVEGTWAVPFAVDERRVAKVAPGKTVEVSLDAGAALEPYLRRLSRSGWWPDRLRLQAMLEPHAGTSSIQAVEETLDVTREGAR